MRHLGRSHRGLIGLVWWYDDHNWPRWLINGSWAGHWNSIFHFDTFYKIAPIFFVWSDPSKNSTDLNSLGPQLSIAGLKSVEAHREGTFSFAQSWLILKNTRLRSIEFFFLSIGRRWVFFKISQLWANGWVPSRWASTLLGPAMESWGPQLSKSVEFLLGSLHENIFEEIL